MEVFKAPSKTSKQSGQLSIFLGGSIEMGKARDWQTKLTDFVSKQPYSDKIVIFNPRRDDWDSSWVQRANNKQFREQVEWELDKQSEADINVYFFAENTMSPITLLELGLFHQTNPVIGADSKYERLGNLEITSERYNLNLNIGWERFLVSLDRTIERKLK